MSPRAKLHADHRMSGMDNITDITLHILTDIRDAIRAQSVELCARIDQTNARLDQTNARLEQAVARIDRTNARIDNLISVTGSAHRVQDTRMDQLEARMTRLELAVERSR